MSPSNNQAEARHAAIVGGGIAGSLLAHNLLHRGWRVSLWDDGAPEAASRVAAGLFNVITGRFGAKSWEADLLLGHLRVWLEEETQRPFRQFIHNLPIYRPFKTVEEYNKWQGRFSNPAFSEIVDFQEQPYRPEVLHNPLGGIWIKPCGWVDVAGLTAWIRDFVRDHPRGRLMSHRLDHEAIDPVRKLIRQDGLELHFDHLVFCEGYRLQGNPFFPEVPMIPNKGELLLLEAPDLKLEVALSRKVYLVPVGNDRYIAGSTYANRFDDPLPGEDGKAEILEKLSQAATFSYRILEHKAGIRPTTPDRRPLLGSHPEYPCVHLVSGFGTKGMLQGPYFTERMAAFLENPPAHPLPEATLLSRFHKS